MTAPRAVPKTLPEQVGAAENAIEGQVDAGRAGEDRHRHQITATWYIVRILAVVAVPCAYFAVGAATLRVPAGYAPLANHLAAALILGTLIVGVQRLVELIIDKETADDNVTFFNLKLLLKLVAGILVCLVFLSAISQTWYTVPIALGAFSIVAGFALQTPMTSFVGWVYILLRKPYRVGDRIQIAGATGDVIDVSYTDTTLWEFGGPYLSTDHPSGRIIKFPNSMVLNSPVYNYSWVLFPYIWDEIRFLVAYDCDLDFVGASMLAVAKSEVGKIMAERVRAY